MKNFLAIGINTENDLTCWSVSTACESEKEQDIRKQAVQVLSAPPGGSMPERVLIVVNVSEGRTPKVVDDFFADESDYLSPAATSKE